MSILRYLFSTINHVVTVVLSLLLILTYLGASIPPASAWWLSLLSLAAPFIVIATVIVMLYNAARFNWITILPLAVLLSGIDKIDGQFNMLFFKDYSKSEGGITILSHNVRVFADDKWNNAIDSTVNLVQNEDPDIIAFQEFYVNREYDMDVIHEMLEEYEYSAVDYFQKGRKRGVGLAIFSKYKIVDRGSEIFYGRYCGMQWVDLAIASDTVRVFNIHMKSNKITLDDAKVISGSVTDLAPLFEKERRDNLKVSKISSIITKFRDHAIERSYDSDTLSQIIESSPFRVVVCGDLNDVPFSYSYDKIKGDLNDSYSLKGDLYGYSYNKLYRLLKIDYIFTSDHYYVNSYDAPSVPYSDHNPIIINISKKK